jgi:hypothetical protein
MDDGGIQEEARFLAPTRSGGSRWVDGSEVDSSESAQWSLDDGRRSAEDSTEGITPSRLVPTAVREAAAAGGLARRRGHERALRARLRQQGAFRGVTRNSPLCC